MAAETAAAETTPTVPIPPTRAETRRDREREDEEEEERGEAVTDEDVEEGLPGRGGAREGAGIKAAPREKRTSIMRSEASKATREAGESRVRVAAVEEAEEEEEEEDR